MPVEADIIAYHRSIGAQLIAVKDRVRNLIGSSHWGEDGAYKEAVLRKLLKEYIPEQLSVGSGFVSTRNGLTRQLDVLIIDKRLPTLFKDGDSLIVTPEVPTHIVEVKTKLKARDRIDDALKKLADNAEKVRKNGGRLWVGLLAYEFEDIPPEYVLDSLVAHTNGRPDRVIDCISLGNGFFIRFWGSDAREHNEEPNTWSLYHFRDYAEGLSFGYFVGNLVWSTNSGHPAMANGYPEYARRTWFPLVNGKSNYRIAARPL